MYYKIPLILIIILSLTSLLMADNPTTLDMPSTFQAKTPIDKGGIILSGDAQITFGGGDLYTDQTQIAFQPSILVFIIKRFAVGADVAIIYNNYENDDDLQLAVGPNFAFFMGSGHDKMVPFIEFSPRYTRVEVSEKDYHHSSNSSLIRRVEFDGIQLAGALGAANFVGRNAAVTIASGFT